MNAPPKIPPALRASQARAANPDASVFVSANAGSGKTWVLTRRVINLLLQGVDPAKILCITYTKAAAANMSNRVFDTLAQWTTLDDAAFDKRIEETTGGKPTARQRILARRLFATAIETPGGLKVQTIHAFCTRLLHQFPFEADVAVHFEVLDESATKQLLERLTLEVMLDASRQPDGPLGQALATAITSAADITFKDVIAEMIRRRDTVTKWVGRAGSVAKAIEELSRAFGLDADDTMDALETEYLSASEIDRAEWPALVEILSNGSSSDRKQADRLTICAQSSGRECVESYIDLFCTDARKRRDSIVTKAFETKNSAWAQRLASEQDRVCKLVAKEKALRARDRTGALLTIAYAVIDKYARAKEERGLLDYDDLIDKTLALFRDTSSAWVHYKLDLGVDHVLVDEAQDTSPKQWDIIKTIASEFPPGGSRDNVCRTMFAVGDEKQSIFSFQGAVPLAFSDASRHFERLFTEAGAQFYNEKLPFSFRSSPIILNAVDTVFSHEVAYRGLTHDPVKTVHEAVHRELPGDVEVWDIVAPDPKDTSKEAWDAPFDTARESSPAIKLAAKIGRTVRRWCNAGTRPRDVLILVRQRGPIFEAVIRALKHEGIAVAGADRLLLTEHIAVMDLMVLGDALLLPDDDLALATVLKSPLFGLSEDELFTLAHGRKGSLRGALRRRAGEQPAFEVANRAFDELREAARTMTPFAFYAHVLGARHGRRKILGRLGVEAIDPLDEFLNIALDYERRETPSLQGFLHWLRVAQSEVKRDMEMERDEVRVMTVHGAKGLEARNVILIDATTVPPQGAYPPRLLTTQLDRAAPGATALIWGARKDLDVGPMSDARATMIDQALNEYRRLLYVGLTRAAERLVVCATKGVNKMPDACWYQLVGDAIRPHASEDTDADGDKVWRMRKGELPAPKAQQQELALPPAPPAWLGTQAQNSVARARAISPSDSGDDEPLRFAARGDRDAALRRGNLSHRLLQSLPDILPERRDAAARAFFAKETDVTPEAREAITNQVMTVLGDQRFAPLFAPGSRAEVSIAGEVMLNGELRTVAGYVDRLVVTDTEVLIGDYKTNRPPPTRIADVPPSYLRQLALYRAVLRKIYPTRIVRAALIWTETPDLMELSHDVLDDALAHVTSA